MLNFLPLSFKRDCYSYYYGKRYRDLNLLAEKFLTDKWGVHHYTPHYQTHFEEIRHKPITLLEIGVGGYDDPTLGGNSLRMWKAYFPKGRVYGIDIHDKRWHDTRRIKTFQGSQTDEKFLNDVISEIGQPDIIIDDGSHYTDHVVRTFEILFPLLAQDGYYVVEDLQTSYWESTEEEAWNGSPDITAPHTSMNYFKSLADGLNHAERIGYEPNYFDLNVFSLHFYHNLLFIRKGLNNEPSNMITKP